jgi:CheY-like chemotaxis protein
MSESQTLTAARVPTVYFIDDSATMREVIKIAFRRENIHVITCADAASALAQFPEAAPDAVITDVIMPDKDGYEVCQFVRRHETLSKVPVILMSGIVNQSVAEKAMTVKADELIRKPFQPQDLVARVKGLIGGIAGGTPGALPEVVLGIKPTELTANAESSLPVSSADALSSLFSSALSSPNSPPALPWEASAATRPASKSSSVHNAPAQPAPASAPPPRLSPQSGELQNLRNENLRLELLVKRLQAELAAGREYCSSLEAHFKRLQETE